jgi:hypothetical protein
MAILKKKLKDLNFSPFKILNITAVVITKHSVTILSIMTIRIKTLSIMTLSDMRISIASVPLL